MKLYGYLVYYIELMIRLSHTSGVGNLFGRRANLMNKRHFVSFSHTHTHTAETLRRSDVRWTTLCKRRTATSISQLTHQRL